MPVLTVQLCHHVRVRDAPVSQGLANPL
ncbi:protein of unknown function [Streptomyces sp. KY70]|nr:protein of unknown function [Streptomyces sp. KY70]